MFRRVKKQYLGSCILISCLLFHMTIGCDYSKSKKNKPDTPNYLKRFYSQKELDKMLKVGMSRQEVINIFGVPFIEGDDIFVYYMDLSKKITKKKKDRIIGFSVMFRNNKVVRWGLAYTG